MAEKAKDKEQVCPNCGHCPTCGRSNKPPVVVYPQPWAWPYQWPWVTTPYAPVYGSGQTSPMTYRINTINATSGVN